MQRKAPKIGFILLAGLITVFLYILLHELGHTVVMLSAGATITEFSIISAHVSGTGGNYTDLSDLWLHANGALLPVIVALIYALLYKKDAKSVFYHLFSYVFLLIPIGSLFAWVIIPFLYLQGNAPAGDDVTNFLYNFSQNHHPLLVSAAAAFLIAAGVTAMVKRGIFRNFISAIRNQ
ncbi:MAG: hypothetical protein Q4D50_02060 [Eubacteriales bacterium]|nr:hypothetical protein [Eubacteriales bacterium]